MAELLHFLFFPVFSCFFNCGEKMLREDASGTDHVRCGVEVCLSLPSPVGGCREGESGRNELLRGPFALFGVRIGMLSS